MDQQWYYVDLNGRNGPVSLHDLTTILANSPSAAEVLVWCEGQEEWTKVGDLPELASFTRVPPTLPDTVNLQPTVWKARWWWLIFAIGLSGAIGSRDGRRMMAWQSAERRKARRSRTPSQKDNVLPDVTKDVSKAPLSSALPLNRPGSSEDCRKPILPRPALCEPTQTHRARYRFPIGVLPGTMNALLVLVTLGGGLLWLALQIVQPTGLAASKRASEPEFNVTYFMESEESGGSGCTSNLHCAHINIVNIPKIKLQSLNQQSIKITGIVVNENPKCTVSGLNENLTYGDTYTLRLADLFGVQTCEPLKVRIQSDREDVVYYIKR